MKNFYSDEERAEILSNLKEFINQERPSLNDFIAHIEDKLK